VLDNVMSGRGAEMRRTELLFVLSPRVLAVGRPVVAGAPGAPREGDTPREPASR
jgi:hypothetical protein